MQTGILSFQKPVRTDWNLKQQKVSLKQDLNIIFEVFVFRSIMDLNYLVTDRKRFDA